MAIKVIKAEAYREYKDLVEREIMVWHAVGYHPNIVKLREVLQSDKRIYFVAGGCNGWLRCWVAGGGWGAWMLAAGR